MKIERKNSIHNPHHHPSPIIAVARQQRVTSTMLLISTVFLTPTTPLVPLRQAQAAHAGRCWFQLAVRATACSEGVSSREGLAEVGLRLGGLEGGCE